ncbi:MAG: glutathione S-transferase family protein [Hyphomonadaceae bacterium]|nr:glutathione S-transferase family protein [Hyphomonadaceae bacterium]
MSDRPKLYHCADARSLRPLWALEELGIAHDLVTLPFPPRFREREFLEINPIGTVPYFVHGNVEMTESSAICQYLVETHGPTPLDVPPGSPERPAFLNWLYFSDATLTFPQTIVLRYASLEPRDRRLPQAVEDYAKWFAGRLRKVETALEGRDWLVADRFTIADICVGYGVFLASLLPELCERLTPNARAYLKRLEARPAFQAAREKQGEPDFP